LSIFQELGAKEVYGIDPEKNELKKAVQAGVIDDEHAIPLILQDIPDELKSKFEIATVFNFNMPYTEYDSFFSAVYNSLPENGEMIMTVAEDEILQNATSTMQKYFVIRSTCLFDNKYDFPHKNLVVCIKKPELLVKYK
jgi:cyclopropane fatty-acyl-phospholipid synthase-like methyltransferase